jgi:hypothetical protein
MSMWIILSSLKWRFLHLILNSRLMPCFFLFYLQARVAGSVAVGTLIR